MQSEQRAGRKRGVVGMDHHLTGPLEQLRGVIGRHPEPGDRYIFEFDEPAERAVHMVGVREPLDVTFSVKGSTTLEVGLTPWTGYASARADRVIEEGVA